MANFGYFYVMKLNQSVNLPVALLESDNIFVGEKNRFQGEIKQESVTSNTCFVVMLKTCARNKAGL